MQWTAKKENKKSVDNCNFLKPSIISEILERTMRKYSWNIAKLIACLIAPSMYISTSTTHFTSESVIHLKEKSKAEINFLTPNFFAGRKIQKISAAMPSSYSAGRVHSDRLTSSALLCSEIISLKAKIAIAKASRTKSDEDIKLGQEALNEMLRMQNILEAQSYQGN